MRLSSCTGSDPRPFVGQHGSLSLHRSFRDSSMPTFASYKRSERMKGVPESEAWPAWPIVHGACSASLMEHNQLRSSPPHQMPAGARRKCGGFRRDRAIWRGADVIQDEACRRCCNATRGNRRQSFHAVPENRATLPSLDDNEEEARRDVRRCRLSSGWSWWARSWLCDYISD